MSYRDPDYNLTYYRKTDRKEFHVKSITALDYMIMDTETGITEPISEFKLRNYYEPDRELNRQSKKVRKIRILPRKAS